MIQQAKKVRDKSRSGSKTGRGSLGVLAIIIIPICTACLLSMGAAPAEKDAQSILDTRVALEKWVETQRIISQEKQDMALASEMLNERIGLVQREIETLLGKIKESRSSVAEMDKKRAGLVEENEILKASALSLNETITVLEERLRKLLVRLPDPIRERVKPLSQRIPEMGASTKLSIAERFQNAVGILNEVDKFNREITTTSEVRTLTDGSSVEVTAVYIGLGQAYYTSGNAAVAGTGSATDTGWVWTADNTAALQISEVIAILKNEKVASFVQLPVTIQ